MTAEVELKTILEVWFEDWGLKKTPINQQTISRYFSQDWDMPEVF